MPFANGMVHLNRGKVNWLESYEDAESYALQPPTRPTTHLGADHRPEEHKIDLACM
jgi:hypothetical protein